MPRNLVVMILDSCRFDSFVEARSRNFRRLGEIEQRWSYASWTAPSHYSYLMGLVPHRSPQHVYASEVYKKDFSSWVDRLNIPDLGFNKFIPQLSLAKVLGDHGYVCKAKVSMPVLNGFTLLNKYFADYKLMPNHNDFAGMVKEIEFAADKPHFYFLNLGETHYPYMLDGSKLPHISGVHGAVKQLAKGEDGGGRVGTQGDDFFDADALRGLHEQQIRCVDYVDELFGALIEKSPPDTYFVVMADHGEAFGEGGYFGHGPVMHEKVFEVPFVEGLRPA
ncbi:sulfatase-like hydrolase/transferase [Ancylobacter sp. MQZ15Z-1]|uniref:Sulfatase-like hydrolase/transferase n=1 Tax=Ancylobacter mangrovi TaxID=2972472 RepID=A0A9X2PDQ5_9HYPH|nr:sulfatase-like hydrolase/transferase [Ancylobacter mangrovi]MCS0494085.1 sulfatase-like hydrolase/transferase [Ancylobacter mangrovi]